MNMVRKDQLSPELCPFQQLGQSAPEALESAGTSGSDASFATKPFYDRTEWIKSNHRPLLVHLT